MVRGVKFQHLPWYFINTKHILNYWSTAINQQKEYLNLFQVLHFDLCHRHRILGDI